MSYKIVMVSIVVENEQGRRECWQKQRDSQQREFQQRAGDMVADFELCTGTRSAETMWGKFLGWRKTPQDEEFWGH